jgi:hypothetical protein
MSGAHSDHFRSLMSDLVAGLLLCAGVAICFFMAAAYKSNQFAEVRPTTQDFARADLVRAYDGSIYLVQEMDGADVTISKCIECRAETWSVRSLSQSTFHVVKSGDNDWQSSLTQWVFQHKQ